MGEGQQAERPNPAQTYATVAGAALILLGLTGFFYNASFATGDGLIADRVFGLFYANGYWNLLHLIAGALGLALAPLAPRFYCLGSAVVWLTLAAGGFFGAHGGEPIPAMGGRIPAGTANDVLCVLLGVLALAALAAAAEKRPSEAKKPRNTKPRVEPESSPKKALGSAETESAAKKVGARPATGIGKPRSATRGAGRPRGPIN